MKTDTRTDDELAACFSLGDQDAFGCLTDRYYAKVEGWAYRQTRSRELAEDLTQDTFLKCSLALRNNAYRSCGMFSGWLFRIVRNALIDHQRRRVDCLDHVEPKRSQFDDETPSRIDTIATSREANPAELAETSDLAAVIRDRLADIPEDQRTTLEFYADGESLPDIAYSMECGLPTAKSRLRLCREKIREVVPC